MTDFATQNLVNSGFAALPSFQEESLSLQGLLLRLQGLPSLPLSQRRWIQVDAEVELLLRETA